MQKTILPPTGPDEPLPFAPRSVACAPLPYPPAEQIPGLLRTLRKARARSDRQQEGLALVGLGDAYLGLGNLEQGAAHMMPGVAILRDLGDCDTVIHGFYQLASTYHHAGAWREAAGTYEQFAMWALSREEEEMATITLLWAGAAYRAVGALGDALRVYETAAPLVDRQGHPDDIFLVAMARGDILHQQGRHLLALSFIEQAVELAGSLERPETTMNCRRLLWQTLDRLGDRRKAREQLILLLVDARRRADIEEIAPLLARMAYYSIALSEWSQAVSYLQEVSGYLPLVGPIAVQVDLLLNLSAFLVNGQGVRESPDRAIPHLLRSIDLARRHRLRRPRIDALCLLGRARSARGEHTQSLIDLQEAMRHARSARDRRREANALHWQSVVYDRLGDFQRARRLHNAVSLILAQLDGKDDRVALKNKLRAGGASA